MASINFEYLSFVGRVAAGRQLLDPIEVFYLPEMDTIYPINSKAGCSTVKLVLIQKYAPETHLVHPAVHLVDPAELTDERVRRHFFQNIQSYVRFCRGKNVVLVTRDPYARQYSAYNNQISGKVTMHYHYSRLRKALGFDRDLTFGRFVDCCSRVPARYADRHYRPQSIYLPGKVRRDALSWSTVDITAFSNLAEGTPEKTGPILNASGLSLPNSALSLLQDHRGFQRRYREDISWYAGA